MSRLIVRRECPGDAPMLRPLITAAFAGTRHGSGTEAAIVEALRDADALHLSLVADEDGVIHGHVAFSPVTVDGRDEGWLGLGPVAVAPHRQRAGIGGALIRRGMAMLRDQGAAGCVLLGAPGYYSRFGFASNPALTYGDRSTPFLQYVSFDRGVPSGQVRFHAGFAAR